MAQQQQGNSWLQHALQRTGWQPQRQAIALGVLGVFIVLMMGGLYLSQVAMEASRGREMRTLITLRDEIERSNEELRVEIAELKSLTQLQARAAALGFVPASRADQLYLVVDGYVAHRVETVAPLVEDETDAPIYDESFGGWLSAQVEALTRQFETFSSQP
ncbi:MAG TPA: hypothetical protein PKX07_04295 [Aggregatilineales bacterium]|jgi:hypothetical protein|nr:hypothetical protein [Aggregatilineales bacterium]